MKLALLSQRNQALDASIGGGQNRTIKALNLGEVAHAQSLPGWSSNDIIGWMLVRVCGLTAVLVNYLEDCVDAKPFVRIEVDALAIYNGLGKVFWVNIAAHDSGVWR